MNKLSIVLLSTFFCALTAVLLYIPITNPDLAMELSISRGELHETDLDIYQHYIYYAALAIAVIGIIWSCKRPAVRIFWFGWAWVISLLLWREMTIDESIVGANTFSYGKYLFEESIPLVPRLAVGGGSMLFLIISLVYFFRTIMAQKESFFKSAKALLPNAGGFVGLTVITFIISMIMDKARRFDRSMGSSLYEWDFRMYTEECMEMYAPFFLICSMYILFKYFSSQKEV